MRRTLIFALLLASAPVFAQHYVALTWTQSADPNVVYNNVYRGTQHGGPYTQIYSSFPNPATSYNDYGCSGA